MPALFLHGSQVFEQDSGTRPIRSQKSSVIGMKCTAPDAALGFPLNKPFFLKGPREANELGIAGTAKDAYTAAYEQGASEIVMSLAPEGANDAETKANIAGDPTAGTGIWSLENAESILDMKPRILCAPGFTSGGPVNAVDPVASNIISLGEKTRAVGIKDGPNTDETDAKLDRQNYGSDRLFIVDPFVTRFDTVSAMDVTRPPSAYVAGLIAKRDVEKGYHWSPSNQVIRGITGTARPIPFNLNSPLTEANRMNEAEVATIVRRSGFRLWGNRSTTEDAQWAFLSVRRTADILYDSIEAAQLWAMDRPISAQLIMDIRDSVQAFGDELVRLGALVGFKCWLDPELNTEETLKAGKVYLNFDFEPPAPLENLIFHGYRNGLYYNDLTSSVKAAA